MKSLVKKISSTVVCMLMAISLSAASKDYQATWESLDAKPIAPWFEQAKFGNEYSVYIYEILLGYKLYIIK